MVTCTSLLKVLNLLMYILVATVSLNWAVVNDTCDSVSDRSVMNQNKCYHLKIFGRVETVGKS